MSGSPVSVVGRRPRPRSGGLHQSCGSGYAASGVHGPRPLRLVSMTKCVVGCCATAARGPAGLGPRLSASRTRGLSHSPDTRFRDASRMTTRKPFTIRTLDCPLSGNGEVMRRARQVRVGRVTGRFVNCSDIGGCSRVTVRLRFGHASMSLARAMTGPRAAGAPPHPVRVRRHRTPRSRRRERGRTLPTCPGTDRCI